MTDAKMKHFKILTFPFLCRITNEKSKTVLVHHYWPGNKSVWTINLKIFKDKTAIVSFTTGPPKSDLRVVDTSVVGSEAV